MVQYILVVYCYTDILNRYYIVKGYIMAQTNKTKTTKKTAASPKADNTAKKTSAKEAADIKKENKKAKNNRSEKDAGGVSSFAYTVGPYVLAVCAGLLAVCMLAGDGIVGGGIQHVFCGLFGVIAYTLPLYLVIFAFLWRSDYECGIVRWKVLAVAVIIAMTAVLVHVFDKGASTLHPVTLYEDGRNLHGGGVIGGWLGGLLLGGFGTACTLVIAFGTLFILGLFLFGITPRGIWITLLYKIRVAREKREERREKAAQSGIAVKNRIREEEYAAYLREKKRQEREAKKQEQIPIPTPEPDPVPAKNPTVYKVRRCRVTDIPVDDDGTKLKPKKKKRKIAAGLEDMPDIVLPEAHPVAEAEDVAPEAGTVDERIFDEVMRRTRERVEKTARQSGMTLQENNGPAEENSMPADSENDMENCLELDRGELLPEENDRAPWDDPAEEEKEEDISSEIAADVIGEPAAGASNVLITPTGVKTISTEARSGDGNVDLTGIFVNPEDAALLDRLSAAYMQKDSTLGVARQNIGSAQNQTPAVKMPKEPVPEYNFPPISILTEDKEGQPQNIKEELQENAVKLVETLRSFNVKTKIENISRGPTITRYELCPEPGTKVRSIVNLVDDIALNLATTGVRIEAPIPGKAAVGVEVPNKKQSTVHLRTLIDDEKFAGAKSKLTCCLGADVAGDSIYFDIAKMPHLLIAGATGMGKSVCINSLIVSLLYKAKPDEVKLILVDPKKVELSIYNGIPHLLVPVVSEPKKAAGSLSWAVGEMERRFGLIEAVGVRDVKMFNEVTKNDPDYEYLPQIVIIIDELADLMMTAPDDVEESICRLAQKARAAGMHLIIGTQRPSVDVITGLIKANIPSRIAFTVASQVDSRTIIDRSGAENLIGRGDMLFNPVGAAKPMRVQGAFVSEADVEEIVSYIKNMNQKCESYSDEVLEQIEKEALRCGSGKKGGGVAADLEEGMDGDEDPMLRQALELAVDSGKISTSLIQRRLSLGYGRAAKLIDRMEQMGYVSPPEGQKPRNVLITKQEFMEMVLKNEMQ